MPRIWLVLTILLRCPYLCEVKKFTSSISFGVQIMLQSKVIVVISTVLCATRSTQHNSSYDDWIRSFFWSLKHQTIVIIASVVIVTKITPTTATTIFFTIIVASIFFCTVNIAVVVFFVNVVVTPDGFGWRNY